MTTKQDTRKATSESILTLYSLVSGLAVTHSLLVVFTDVAGDGSLIPPKKISLERILLCIIFISTVLRFTHGAILHIQTTHDDNSRATYYKPLLDLLGFMLQAAAFFVTAAALGKDSETVWFLKSFLFVLIVDTVWIMFVALLANPISDVVSYETIKGICKHVKTLHSDPDKEELHYEHRAAAQWVASNFVFMISVCICLYFDATEGTEICLTLVATFLFFWDYWHNTHFYFGKKNPN